jgi:hypothetical protein
MKCLPIVYAALLTLLFFLCASISQAENAQPAAADQDALIKDLFGLGAADDAGIEEDEFEKADEKEVEDSTDKVSSRARLADPDERVLDFILEPSVTEQAQPRFSRIINPPETAKEPESEAEQISIFLAKEQNVPASLINHGPRSKGPWVDPESENRITSRYAWPKPKAGSCGEAVSSKAVQLKAQSLKEVLFRFTGTDEYYDKLNQRFCVSRCSTAGNKRGVFSGLAVSSSNRGGFSFVEEGGFCRYALVKSGLRWPNLNGQKIVCSCVQE